MKKMSLSTTPASESGSDPLSMPAPLALASVSRSLFSYYVIKLGDHRYLDEMFHGSPVDCPLHMAQLFNEDEVHEAAELAEDVHGELQVVYLSEPISLKEFCKQDDTSEVTRKKCEPYCK